MGIRIRQTTDEELIKKLDAKIFGKGLWYNDPLNVYWIAKDERGEIAGYCIATPRPFDEVFLSRVGVFKKFRGHNLQKRMIRVRMRWAKSHGFKHVVTYTAIDNGPSIKSLLDCGLKIFTPEWQWAGKVITYFIGEL